MSFPRFTVCIPAAGGGSRMASDTPKQYLPLLGVPMIVHTLRIFASMEECERIIVATDDAARLGLLLREHSVGKECALVSGGAERKDSVLSCLRAVTADTIVLVHDAARPCVTREEVRAVAQAVSERGAALLALPSRDTVKRVEPGGRVAETIPRTEIYLAQTPQGAFSERLRSACEAASGTLGITDDMQLLERLGIPVYVVEGSPANLKVTTPQDRMIAESILRERLA